MTQHTESRGILLICSIYLRVRLKGCWTISTEPSFATIACFEHSWSLLHQSSFGTLSESFILIHYFSTRPYALEKMLGGKQIGGWIVFTSNGQFHDFFSTSFSKTTLAWSSVEVAVKWRKRLGRRRKMIMPQPLKKSILSLLEISFTSPARSLLPDVFLYLHYYYSFSYSRHSGLIDLNGSDSLG